jgi:nucleoside-diphosphate-sugar epimerase
MNSKRILVTGTDGFIGSHLTETLLEKGHSVKELSYYYSFNEALGLRTFVTFIWKW